MTALQAYRLRMAVGIHVAQGDTGRAPGAQTVLTPVAGAVNPFASTHAEAELL